MSTTDADHLRARAHRLRRLARTIEALPVMRLDSLAGDDTWRGPRPLACRNALERDLARLHAAVERLRWHAYTFEQQAAACDVVGVR